MAVLVAMMTVALSPSLPSLDLPHTRPSSGCHEHGGKAPVRSYDCCLIGHDVAAPQAFHFYRPAVGSTDFDFQLSSSLSGGAVVLYTSTLLALSPPGETSLRI